MKPDYIIAAHAAAQIGAIALAYALGAFVFADLNIVAWGDGGRFSVALAWVCLVMPAALCATGAIDAIERARE